MNLNSLYILGTGSYSAVITELALDAGYSVAGYIDEDPEKQVSLHNDLKVMSPETAINTLPRNTLYAASIGDNLPRLRLCARLVESGGRFPSIVHSRSYVSPSAQLGSGVYINAMASVLAEARVSHHTIVCSGSVLSHHTNIGEGVLVGVGAHVGSGTTIGRAALLGAASTIKPGGLSVGAESTVGAGTVVVRDIGENTVYMGLDRT